MRISPAALLAMALLAPVDGADLAALQERFFARSFEAMKARPTHDYRNSIYPSEPAIFFLAGWMVTGNDNYLDAMRRQFEISESWVNEDGIFDVSRSGRFPQGVSRDSTARQIYNSYTAGSVLGDRHLLALADRCAEGMVRHVERQRYEYRGSQFTLFATTVEAKPPYKVNGRTWIDVNQNAELGLAFTLLYHDRQSRFYRSKLAREIAFNELRAGMSIQNMETGEIPIGSSPEWITKYDSMYGSYALFSWTWANRFWRNPEMERHIRKAVEWLDPFYNGETRSVHWYPKHLEAKAPPGSEWWLVAAFHEHGKDLERLFRFYASGIAGGNVGPSWQCGQPYLYAMHLPAAILRQAGLPEKWIH